MTKLVITLAVPGLPFNGKTFDRQSLGGSESAGYYLARALAKLGHSVTVFCNTPEQVRCADVDYLPLGLFKQYIEYTPHDLCIAQRTPELLMGYSQAKFTILWCHDLAMRRAEGGFRGVSWNYDRVAVLSEFMRAQYRDVYNLGDDQLFVTRNGVDLEAVARAHAEYEAQEPRVARNPLSIVYSARPERGLDIMLGEIMPRILKEEPNARLFLSKYENPVDQLRDFYGHCEALARQLGDAVVDLGSLTKHDLFTVYHGAGMYAYPMPSRLVPDFDEISCISIMEAQACGLPVVTTKRGALPETLAPGAGTLISERVHTGAYADAFAAACLRYMRHPDARRAASAAGLARAQELSWDAVARQWADMVEAEIRKNSADLATLANHFWRRSDIYAAAECVARLPADDARAQPVRERLERDFGFIHKPDGFRLQYEAIGRTHDERVINWSPHEPRYKAVRAWLEGQIAKLPNDGSLLSVLDYGCAHGGYAINLLKELPRLRITGVDIDLRGIQMADNYAAQLGVADRWRGVVGDLQRLTDPDVPEMRERYQVVMCQEVLEHVPDPAALIAAIDQRVADGGVTWWTVPFGPWEYSDYRRYPHRAHIREFDLHDLHDLLDVKGRDAQVSISAMPFGHSQETDDALGWWVVQYIVTDSNRGLVGQIDMDRKLAIQRPRQTVSACIMAGPHAEDMLHWCLRSLVHVADELIIADCGLSAEAHRIIDLYRWGELDGLPHDYILSVRVIPGGDPKVEGFETPRNRALEVAGCDWILWIDTDEKLLQPEKLTKYLKRNAFDGYSIRQHHFSIDANFGADLPVRLFRNPRYTGSGMRFIGMIHEHPEKGLNAGPGLVTVLPDVHIPHVGYLIESGRRQKFGRNLPMLEADMQKYPERLLQKHFIMRDKMLLVAYELQQNGGRVTAQIRQACSEVVELYRRYFLGKGHFTNSDPIDYYSQANAVLAQGFDAQFSMTVDKVQAHPNGSKQARFASTEDFVTEMSARARDMAQPLETRYW